MAAVFECSKQSQGVRAKINVDNGPEVVLRALNAWAKFNNVKFRV